MDAAINTATEAALEGNPIAMLLMVVAGVIAVVQLILATDKVWYHAQRRKGSGEVSPPSKADVDKISDSTGVIQGDIGKVRANLHDVRNTLQVLVTSQEGASRLSESNVVKMDDMAEDLADIRARAQRIDLRINDLVDDVREIRTQRSK